MYICQSASGLPQERALSLMRLDQAHRAVGAQNGNRNPGESRTGADICDVQIANRQVNPEEDGFTVVALDDFLHVTEASQV